MPQMTISTTVPLATRLGEPAHDRRVARRSAQHDSDGFGVDDLADRRRPDRVASTPAQATGLAQVDLAGAWSCRPSSTATPISTRATSGRASPIRTARFMGALDAVGERPRGQLGGARRGARAWSSRCAAPTPTAPGDPHASRQRAAAGDDLLAGLRRDARALGGPHRACRRPACSASTRPRDEDWFRAHGGDRAAPSRRARRGHLHDARPRRTARPHLPRRHRTTASTSTSMSTRPATSTAVSLRAHRRGGAAPRLRGPHRGRPLLLARPPARQRCAHTLDQVAARPASASSRCRCATCTCRTAGPTAARRAGAASRCCTR